MLMDNFMFITFETYAGEQICLAVQQRQLHFFINPRALFYHNKCHSINIHKLLDGNIY